LKNEYETPSIGCMVGSRIGIPTSLQEVSRVVQESRRRG
jgi:hypothetical protein